ncbi:immediate early response gene 2 protein-like [Synchiropus splendidus]|uniref:immediate early response gene 2 protein-like n=1 Tax=Synchiropus splendidus TaxID=270530 RepID=UPI00237EC810|nr:immediate early response gene 2 protein-like [Synchiropus splendidus]
MEVGTEAKRIMVVALGKLYSSRTQRGGLRLHRSLLLSLVMKSARDIYHAAYTEPQITGCLEELYPVGINSELEASAEVPSEPARSADDKENACPSAPTSPSRKRRGRKAAVPDFLPCKKAKLEQQLSSALTDFGSYSDLAVPQSPLLVHRTVAVC